MDQGDAVQKTRWRRWGAGAGLVAAGAITGGILASTVSASADTDTTTPDSSTSQPVDPSQPQRSDEQLLTGDTKAEVEAAVLAAYPGATIQRTETDSDGVYESHIVTSDGQDLTVQVGADFAVTGTDAGGPGGHGHGHHGDDGDDDGDAGGSAPTQQSPGA
jgi:hypothetical protein